MQGLRFRVDPMLALAVLAKVDDDLHAQLRKAVPPFAGRLRAAKNLRADCVKIGHAGNRLRSRDAEGRGDGKRQDMEVVTPSHEFQGRRGY